MKTESGFIRKEVEALLGVSARKIQFYTDEGLLTPGIENPRGRGTTRRYSKKNLFELLVIQELSSNGVLLEAIKILMQKIMVLPHTFWDEVHNKPNNNEFLIIYSPNSDNFLVSLKRIEPEKFTLDLSVHTSALVVSLDKLAGRMPGV